MNINEWDSIEDIPSRLLEVNDAKVIIECLIDVDNLIFENREFDKYLIEGIIEFKQYQPILIRTFKKKGVCMIEFIDGVGKIDLTPFEINFLYGITDIFNKKL